MARRLTALIVSTVALAASAPAAGAATIPVDLTTDTVANDANCSLREAIFAASANTVNPADGCIDGQVGLDTITLSATGTTYQVTGAAGDTGGGTGDFNPSGADPLTIKGNPGPDGGPVDRIQSDGADRVISFAQTSGAMTLDTVIVENGAIPGGFGGNIMDTTAGSLTIVNSWIRNGDAAVAGGNIQAGVPLTVRDSVIGGPDPADGGTAQTAAAINTGASLTMERSQVLNNVSVDPGDGGQDAVHGAVTVFDGPTVIRDSTFADNSATASETIDQPTGGALFNSGGNLTITGSTFEGNSVAGGTNAQGGAVFAQIGTVNIVNSTFSGNSTGASFFASRGGAVSYAAVDGDATFIHDTFAGNTAVNGGDAIFAGDTTVFRGSLFDNGANACFNPNFTANAYNVDAGSSCVGATADTDRPNATTGLGALGSNLGPTQTRALVPPSDAIDAVPFGACLDQLGAPLATDQRGAERPFGAACDAGAFERVTCGGQLPTILGGPAADDLAGTAGADSILGSGGNDVIDGGADADQICGGSGDDTILAADGLADSVDCGAGNDTVTPDQGLDTLTACEVNTRAPIANDPGGPTKKKCKKGRKPKKVKGKKRCVKKKKKKKKKK